MRHKVNNHRLFILSCFIPNSFSFFWFLWFSLCLIVASFSLFRTTFEIGRSLCRTFGGVCIAFDVFYVHGWLTGWLPAWEKAIQTHMCRHRTQYSVYQHSIESVCTNEQLTEKRRVAARTHISTVCIGTFCTCYSEPFSLPASQRVSQSVSLSGIARPYRYNISKFDQLHTVFGIEWYTLRAYYTPSHRQLNQHITIIKEVIF